MVPPATTIETRTKSRPNSKVGVSLSKSKNRIKIVKVHEHGLFGGSGIRAGQELISINGASVRGKTLEEVLAMLASLPSEVTLQTGPGEQVAWLKCTLDTMDSLGFDNNQRKHVPSFLASRGVPHPKWLRLVNLFTNDLMPAVNQAFKMDKILQDEMAFCSEKKVFMMTQQSAIQHSNLTLVANNVVSVANALLNKHGVVAELKFHEKKLMTYSSKQQGSNYFVIPIAMRFSPIDPDGEDEEPTNAPPMATAIVDSDC